METLQEKIIQSLLDRIAAGKHGDLLPSQNSLRAEFNVSTVTIRLAFQHLEQRGVLFRRRGKGCFIRKPQCDSARMRLFLILPRDADPNGDFFRDLFVTARDDGYQLMFYNYDGDRAALLDETRRFRPDFILWGAPNVSREHPLLKQLAGETPFLLLFNRICNIPGIHYVSGDFLEDGRRLGEMFRGFGGQRVLYIGLDEAVDFSRFRCEGFMRGAAEHAVVDVLPFDAATYRRGDLIERAARRLSGTCYAGIVVSQGALWDDMDQALRRSQVASDRVLFGGFDRLPESVVRPPRIYCVLQPLAEMRRQVFCGMRELYAGRVREWRKVLRSELVSNSLQ